MARLPGARQRRAPDYEYVPYPDEDEGARAVEAEPATIEARIKELLGEDFLEKRRQEETARRIIEGEPEVREQITALAVAEGINAADGSKFTERMLALVLERVPKMEDPALTAEQKAELEIRSRPSLNA